jgi:hypothetical protein
LKSINISRNVEILGKSCFSDSKVELITFENESQLAVIEDFCFLKCSMKSINIPRNVEYIAGSVFLHCNCRAIIVDKIENRLVLYFGDSVEVSIWQEIKILGESCFCGSKVELITFEKESQLTLIEESCFLKYSFKSINIPRNVEVLGCLCFDWSKVELITFEKESRLTRIEESCFLKCSLKSINIPRNVEILGKSCFSRSKVESITFEKESRLTRIEESCFSSCSLKSIIIPRNVEYIAGSAIENSNCRVILDDQNNHRFSIDRYFIVDKIENHLVCYFGHSSRALIW